MHWLCGSSAQLSSACSAAGSRAEAATGNAHRMLSAVRHERCFVAVTLWVHRLSARRKIARAHLCRTATGCYGGAAQVRHSNAFHRTLPTTAANQLSVPSRCSARASRACGVRDCARAPETDCRSGCTGLPLRLDDSAERTALPREPHARAPRCPCGTGCARSQGRSCHAHDVVVNCARVRSRAPRRRRARQSAHTTLPQPPLELRSNHSARL